MKRIVLVPIIAVAIIAGLFAPVLVGCKPRSTSTTSEDSTSDNVLWRNELFDYAIDAILNQTDQFHSPERQQQTINRLDQWIRLQKPLEGWEPDPLIAGVAESLDEGSQKLLDLGQTITKLKQGEDPGPLENLSAEFDAVAEKLALAGHRLTLIEVLQLASQMKTMADQLQPIIQQNVANPTQMTETLRSAFSQFDVEQFALLGVQLQMLSRRIDPSILEFPSADSLAFQAAVWIRDVSTWASGDEMDDPIKPAVALFDWVVKNVDLVRDPQLKGQDGAVRVLQSPMETLLFGRGSGIDRAWLFVLLARQMNIDAVLLGLADENNNLNRLWGVGVLLDGEIYLFEPVLGLPIPKPGSLELTEKGLVCEPATLAEAAENDAVLDQLDVLKKGSYAVSAKDMQHAIALVEASPAYLTQRMKMVQNRLTGDQKIVLTTDPTAQLERFKQCRYIVDGQMWPLPYQTIWQEIRLGAERQKWLANNLRPFVFPPQVPLLWQARSLHFKGKFVGKPSATMFYQAARRSDFNMDSADIEQQDKRLWQEIKIDASYWLGLVVAQTGNYRSAEDYLKTRVLVANPGGKWEYGATYNLARVAEATGDIPMAIKLYQIHLAAPQTQGNLIRARWLMELTGQSDLTPKADAASEENEEKTPEAKEGEKPSETPDAEMETEAPKESEASAGDSESKKEDEKTKPEPEDPSTEKQPAVETSEKPAAETPMAEGEASSEKSTEGTSSDDGNEKPEAKGEPKGGESTE